MTNLTRRQFLTGASAAVVVPLTPNLVWWFERWFGRQRWKGTGKTWTAPDGKVLPVGTNWTRDGWERTIELSKEDLRDPNYDKARAMGKRMKLALHREREAEVRRMDEAFVQYYLYDGQWMKNG